MRDFGIQKTYEIKKTVNKKLVYNDKFINWILNECKEERYVIPTGWNEYREITKEDIVKILRSGNLNDKLFVSVSLDPEYDEDDDEGSIFCIEYRRDENGNYTNYRNDWKVMKFSLVDIVYRNNVWREPYYVLHPDEFDWEGEEVIYSDEKLTSNSNCIH